MMNVATHRFEIASWPYSPNSDASREQAKRIRREQFLRASYRGLMTLLAVASLVVLTIAQSY